MDPRLINDRYEVVGRIGKGAMGVVYEAYDRLLDRRVAIKQMTTDVADDQQLRQRFSQEARAAARLNHQNIVTIYDLEAERGDVCIVMELLDGVDLATVMKRGVALPLEARLNIMAQACDGLAYAHRHGVVHRDIKPSNLIVSPEGLVKIVDFGIARLASSTMTTTGGLLGTPNYMSPEQVQAMPVDARSDLFAVGAVLYELVSGAKPFEAESVPAVLLKIVRDPHRPLRERAPHLPDRLIEVVERSLSKNREDRPQSAQEVRDILLSIPTGAYTPGDEMTVTVIAAAIEKVLPAQEPAKVSTQSGPAHDAPTPGAARSGTATANRSIAQRPMLLGVVGIASLLLVALGAGITYLVIQRRAEPTAPLGDAATIVAPETLGTATPPAAEPPAPVSVTAPPQAAVPAAPPAPVARATTPAAPAAGVKPAATKSESRTSEPVAVAVPPESRVPDTPRPADPVTPPPEPASRDRETPASTPAAPPASLATAVTVKHLHARGFTGFFRRNAGNEACEGVLEVVADGISFRTTTPSADGRKEDQRIPFAAIESVELEDGRLLIETDERNWNFSGPADALARIERQLKTKMPNQ